MPGISSVVDVEGCNRAAAAVRSDGTVWMWGEDKGGVMGTGKITGEYESGAEYHRPVRAWAGGSRAHALAADGTLYSWGPTGGSGSPNRVPAVLGRLPVATGAKGILLYQSSVALLGSVQLGYNRGYGIGLVQGSYVCLGHTSASGNNSGIDLYWADRESSYAGAFVTRTIDPNCTDFNN